jgi:hypothetical protein
MDWIVDSAAVGCWVFTGLATGASIECEIKRSQQRYGLFKVSGVVFYAAFGALILPWMYFIYLVKHWRKRE